MGFIGRFPDERNVWLFYVRVGVGGLGLDGDRMFCSSVCYTAGVLGCEEGMGHFQESGYPFVKMFHKNKALPMTYLRHILFGSFSRR